MKKRDWKNIESRRLLRLVSESSAGCVTPDMMHHFACRSFNSLQSHWNRIKGKTLEDFPIDALQQQAEDAQRNAPSILTQEDMGMLAAISKEHEHRKAGDKLSPPVGSNTLTGMSEIRNYLRSHGLRGRVTIELGE